MNRRLAKSGRNKTLTGALGGLSEYWQIDYTWLRLVFIVLTLITKGFFILVYLFITLLIPKTEIMDRGEKRHLIYQISLYTKLLAHDMKNIVFKSKYRRIFGFIFLTLGILWFSQPVSFVSAVLMLLGVVLVFNPFGLKLTPEALLRYETYSIQRIRASYFSIDSDAKHKLPQA